MLDKYLHLLLQLLTAMPMRNINIEENRNRISRVYDTRNFNPQKILSRVWEKLWFIPSCLPNNILHAPTALIEGSGGEEEDSCHATSGVLYAGVAADYLQRVSFVRWACHFRSKQIWHSGSLKHGEWFHKTEFYMYAVFTNGRSGVDCIYFQKLSIWLKL